MSPITTSQQAAEQTQFCAVIFHAYFSIRIINTIHDDR